MQSSLYLSGPPAGGEGGVVGRAACGGGGVGLTALVALGVTLEVSTTDIGWPAEDVV